METKEKTRKKGVKKEVFHEVLESKIDYNTGEVKEETTTIRTVTEREPDYIKLYVDMICVFNEIENSFSKVILEFSKYINYADNSEGGILEITSFRKEHIAKACNVSVSRINQAITAFVKKNIFMPYLKSDGTKQRGVYIVNPYIIAKGKWENIKKLRATFDFMEKTIKPEINQFTVEDFIEKDTEINLDDYKVTLENGYIDVVKK